MKNKDVLYNVNETFYSLKGEGLYTGTAMSFIRMSGCNLNCSFCDTDHSQGSTMSIEQLLAEVGRHPNCRRVVLTGGEPLIDDLSPLIDALHLHGYIVHIETNGTQRMPNSKVNWVACSPKSGVRTLVKDTIRLADEVKFLVGLPLWEEYILDVCNAFEPSGRLYVMPIASGKHEGLRTAEDLIQKNIDAALNFCLKHPKFSLCMQMHKILSIR